MLLVYELFYVLNALAGELFGFHNSRMPVIHVLEDLVSGLLGYYLAYAVNCTVIDGNFKIFIEHGPEPFSRGHALLARFGFLRRYLSLDLALHKVQFFPLDAYDMVKLIHVRDILFRYPVHLLAPVVQPCANLKYPAFNNGFYRGLGLRFLGVEYLLDPLELFLQNIPERPAGSGIIGALQGIFVHIVFCHLVLDRQDIVFKHRKEHGHMLEPGYELDRLGHDVALSDQRLRSYCLFRLGLGFCRGFHLHRVYIGYYLFRAFVIGVDLENPFGFLAGTVTGMRSTFFYILLGRRQKTHYLLSLPFSRGLSFPQGRDYRLRQLFHGIVTDLHKLAQKAARIGWPLFFIFHPGQ